MSKIDRFEDLEVWQLGREICKDIEEQFKDLDQKCDKEIAKLDSFI